MLAAQLLKFLILSTSVCLLLSQAFAHPLQDVEKVQDKASVDNSKELNDLNTQTEDAKIAKILEHLKHPVAESSFAHHDEDLMDVMSTNTEQLSPKYDVELIELRDSMKRETVEIEELFKGSALQVNTDTFISENIEMNETNLPNALPRNHFILSVILIVVALGSITLYGALVMWRSHLEKRYGMRELLVNNEDDVYHTTTTPIMVH